MKLIPLFVLYFVQIYPRACTQTREKERELKSIPFFGSQTRLT